MEKKFQAAVNIIRRLPKKGPFQPSNDLQLKFYSYYKQATEGPCTLPKPSFWDIVNKAKWEAWTSLGNMSREEAMEKYVDELKSIIETMSYTDSVSHFMELLGPFYEVVPIDESNSPIKMNGDREMSDDDMNPTANGTQDSPLKAAAALMMQAISKKSSDKVSPIRSDITKDLPNDCFSNAINGHKKDKELDSDGDEFSDTYDHIQEARGGGEQSFGSSPRGGNPSVASSSGGRSVRPRQGRDAALASGDHASSHPSGGGSGGGYGGGGSKAGGDADGQEQLAIAVVRLQQTMEEVVSRLDCLEELLQQKTPKTTPASVWGQEITNFTKQPWRLFPDLSNKTALFLLLWPLVAHWIVVMLRRRYGKLRI